MANLMYQSRVLQNAREFDEFLSLIQREDVRSYLEIGSMYGGSLWRVASAMPRGSRLVSCDYAVDTPEALPSLKECVSHLTRSGYDAHLIVGDSMAPKTVELVAALGPFDMILIDGAHTLEAVNADWQNYGPMARIVAFHDIAWNETWRSSVPGRPFKAMGVPTLWNDLKPLYRHEEIKFQHPSNYYGLGVLWR